MSADNPAWPCVPRPFADEPFGSWFGRVAARYRITVHELADAAGVSLDFGQDGGSWLIARPPAPPGLSRLSSLCGLPSSSIEALGVTTATPDQRHFHYCFCCLFLNPLEVESPYWHAEWLTPYSLPCTGHPGRWEQISKVDLAKNPNMHRLLRFISRRRSSQGLFGSKKP